MSSFRVELTNYNGPLDLLVETVRRGELSILDVMLSDVALGYLTQMRDRDLDLEEAGEFVVLLSILLELKSRALLPSSKTTRASRTTSAAAGEPSVRRQLQKLTAESVRFDRAVEFLAERAGRRRASLRRLAADFEEGENAGANPTLRELEVWDLTTILSRLLRQGAEVGAQQIARDPTPIGVYQDRLEAKIMRQGRAPLGRLFDDGDTKAQRIGKFLALLELIKSQRVWIEWDAAANDLVCTPPRPQSTTRTQRPVEADVLPISERYAAAVRQTDVPAAPEVWPDLPEVPDFSRRKSAWAGYKPITRGDRPPPTAAAG